jgi:hypothetical protein
MSETSLTEKNVDWLRTSIKEQMDLILKGVAYLMTAHGAGLVGCLTLLKDYNSIPQLKGIGFFITCFAYGLIFAMSAFAGLQFYQVKMLEMIATASSWQRSTTAKLILFVPLAASCGALLVALTVIMTRFGSL